MTAYCPNKLPGTEHTCLCTALAHHIGGHRCACGHTWGDPWHEMTYDQQRAWLGLPLKPINIHLDDLKVAILALLHTDSNFPPARHEEAS